MIFFRTHQVRIRFRKRAESFLLFAKLTAYFDAPVDERSGMTVNLLDVDRWLLKAQQIDSIASVTEALKLYEASLRQSSPTFKKIKLTLEDVSIEFDGSDFLRTYEVKTWFREDSTWVHRPCSLESTKVLDQKWRKRLSCKRWSRPDAFAALIENYLPQIKSLEVHIPEIKGMEKFQF